MKTNFEETVQKLTDFLKSEATTETIVGKEFKLGEYSCVPVMSIGMGIGGGGGEGLDEKKQQGEGIGGGAGIGLSPVGFLVSRGDKIEFIPTKGHSGVSSAFEKIPDLIGKYFEKKEKVSA